MNENIPEASSGWKKAKNRKRRERHNANKKYRMLEPLLGNVVAGTRSGVLLTAQKVAGKWRNGDVEVGISHLGLQLPRNGGVDTLGASATHEVLMKRTRQLRGRPRFDKVEVD